MPRRAKSNRVADVQAVSKDIEHLYLFDYNCNFIGHKNSLLFGSVESDGVFGHLDVYSVAYSSMSVSATFFF
jgi:hypothetical protein